MRRFKQLLAGRQVMLESPPIEVSNTTSKYR